MVKAQVFLTDLNDFAAFDEVWREFFKVPPPRTTVGTSGLLVKDTLIEIDLIAYARSAGLKHEVVTSSNPKPLANYSEAVRVGDLVFAAGQLASDFKTGVARKPAATRISPSTAPTSSCRPSTSSRISRTRSRPPAARSTMW